MGPKDHGPTEKWLRLTQSQKVARASQEVGYRGVRNFSSRILMQSSAGWKYFVQKQCPLVPSLEVGTGERPNSLAYI